MMSKALHLYKIILFSLLIVSCRTIPEEPVIEKNSRRCGEVTGTFRGRWWNYFERGQSYAGCQLWKAAAKDYRRALAQRSDDNSRARTYGMNFVEYFPHRGLGISLYHRRRFAEAIRELEISLSHDPSAKAQFYLDRARRAWILQRNLDHADPMIRLSSELDPGPTNAFAIRIEGLAVDDTYVKQIRLNGLDLPIDLGAAEIPFRVSIQLHPGSNRIHIEVSDICGNCTKLEKRIACDRSGPILNIDSTQLPETAGSSCWIKGYATDPSGIRSICINGERLATADGKEVDFQYPCSSIGSASNIVVVAEDGAGNVTTAVVGRQTLERKSSGRPSAALLLASNGPFPRHFLDPKRSAQPLVELKPREKAPMVMASFQTTAPTPQDGASDIAGEIPPGLDGRDYALIIGAVRGKNIMVITDSCYGGRISRAEPSDALVQHPLTSNKLLALAARKSRQIIASGSLEQVPDWGRDGHSLFASGRIQMNGDTLEIRTRVVAVEDRSILAKADVYGEELDREKIRTMCLGLVNKIRRDLPVVEGRIARVRGNQIVINRGRRHGLKNGLPLILFEEEAIPDPGTGQSLGIDRYPTAQARIDSVREKLSHAVLTGESQGEIAVGQKVITK